MKKLRVLIFLCFLTPASFGQKKESLSDLLNACQSQKEDTLKVNSLYKISFKYLESKLDSCVYYNQLGLNLAKRLHFSRKIPYFFDIIGYVNLYKENYDSAIVCHFEALKLHEKESDPSGMATSYNGIGFVYDLQGNSEKALTYYQKSLRIGEEYKNEGLTANCRKYIGSIYRSRKEYTKAIEYWNEARKYFDHMGNEMEKADLNMHLAACYLQTNVDSCYKYIRSSLNYFCSIHDQLSRRADANLIMAHYYQAKEMPDSAIKYYHNCRITLEELGGRDNLKSTYAGLAASYSLKEDYKNAYRYCLQAYSLTDSLNNMDHVQEIEGKYLKQKEEELRSISTALKEQKERNKSILFLGGILVLALLSVFLILRYRSKIRTNLHLSEKNKLIEEKQQEIIASIRYAQRIQKAHLPNEKRIKGIFERLKKQN